MSQHTAAGQCTQISVLMLAYLGIVGNESSFRNSTLYYGMLLVMNCIVGIIVIFAVNKWLHSQHSTGVHVVPLV